MVKINVIKEANNPITFYDLVKGDFFLYAKNLYQKTGGASAVVVSSGDYVTFIDDSVLPVDVEIIVKVKQ